MQRIIQINLAGRIVPIEEDAYLILKEYLQSLERHFAGEEGKEEIVQDIEYRVAELFSIRLQSGFPAIDRSDVQKVIDTLGTPNELSDTPNNNSSRSSKSMVPYAAPYQQERKQEYYDNRRLFRDPHDKLLGGVCAGLANYYDIDPIIVRLIFAATGMLAFIGVVIYIVAWIIIPVAKTPEDLGYMKQGEPMDFHRMSKNIETEMYDLKKRAEEMSRELLDFFSKKKK